MAEQPCTQGFDLGTIRGAERADQKITPQRLAPVTRMPPRPFSDRDVDLAVEQFVQTRRLAETNGDLRLSPAELRQAHSQSVNVETRVNPDMQQTCDAFRPEFGSGIGEDAKRLTDLRQLGFSGRGQDQLPRPSFEQLHSQPVLQLSLIHI